MAKKLLSLFLIILCIVSDLKADPYKGFSSFAALHPTEFPCANFLKLSAHARKPAMVVLYGTFGDDWTCVERFITKFSHKKHLLEIHFYNGSCLHLHRCFEGELFSSSVSKVNKLLASQDPIILSKIIERVDRITGKVDSLKQSKTTVVLSTGLEDRLSSSAYAVLYNTLRERWPYGLARSPASRHAKKFHSTDYIERHGVPTGSLNGNCIWNGDGFNLNPGETKSIFRKLRHCKVLFAWTREAQGIYWGDFIKPRERTFHLDSWVVKQYASVLKK